MVVSHTYYMIVYIYICKLAVSQLLLVNIYRTFGEVRAAAPLLSTSVPTWFFSSSKMAVTKSVRGGGGGVLAVYMLATRLRTGLLETMEAGVRLNAGSWC